MKKIMLLVLFGVFVLNACAIAPATTPLPTLTMIVVPTIAGTSTAVSTSTPTNTPKPPYTVVTDPHNESGMSWVQLERDPETNMLLLPKQFLEWERAHALPFQGTQEDLNNLIYSFEIIGEGTIDKGNFTSIIHTYNSRPDLVRQLFSFYRISLEPFGVNEEIRLVSYQYVQKDGSPAFIHLFASANLINKDYPDAFIGKNAWIDPSIYDRGQFTGYPPSTWDGLACIEYHRDCNLLSRNIFKTQLNVNSYKEALQIMQEQAKAIVKSKSASFNELLQRLIWMAG